MTDTVPGWRPLPNEQGHAPAAPPEGDRAPAPLPHGLPPSHTVPVDVGSARGHVAGTPLDLDAPVQHVPLPGRAWTLGVFLVSFVAYFAIGYYVTVTQHVVIFDALNRLTSALMVWHNAPPKLAAIGFLFPPLTTAVFLPWAVVTSLASGLVAIPLTTSLWAATALVFIDRTMARCDMPPILRAPVLIAFAANPMWVFYAGNGMSEAVYSAMLAFVLYSFVSWYVTTEPRFLIGSGFGLAFLIVTRYAFIIWGGLIALLIGVALVRRRASRIEVEGSIVAFAAPVIYAVALWILFNALIVGDPFGWITSGSSTQAVNSAGVVQAHHLAFNDVSRRLLKLNVGIFPLALVAVPGLVVTFLAQRNDMALWLASLVVLGMVIIGAHAYLAQDEGLLTLRDSMPMFVTALFGAIWVYRSFEGFRPLIWALTLGFLILNLFTAWHAMQTYKFQSQEQAFTRAISTGKSQEGTSSIGGYTVGIHSEAQMAQYIKSHISGKNKILTDNATTFGVMLLSGSPATFFDRIDKGDSSWNTALDDPYGHVEYLLFTRNSRSGDLIGRHYPNLDQGTVKGLQPVYRTDRYTLIKVTAQARHPKAKKTATSKATTATTPTTTILTTTTTPAGTSTVGGVASP